jgi:MFS family permease
VFLLYVVNYIDRVNVSFANLRMSADLGFSDRVYGLGVGMFYLTYVLFEMPGAIIAERWSARKWIARIMISWGVVTILTGFVHSTAQFYAARFFLGLAEASFFPGMIVYLTHWFSSRGCCRAFAYLYTAVPGASLIGAPIAGWLPGVHWWSLSDCGVTTLLMISALVGIAAMLANGWHSDRTAERRFHAAVPLLVGASIYGVVIVGHHNLPLAISCLLVGSGLWQAFYPLFWSFPTMILSESAAAAAFGLINSNRAHK